MTYNGWTYTFTEINDITGFANGDEWRSDDQVKAYFTIDNMHQMFGDAWEDTEPITQDNLDNMADTVIHNHWHYADTFTEINDKEPTVSVIESIPDGWYDRASLERLQMPIAWNMPPCQYTADYERALNDVVADGLFEIDHGALQVEIKDGVVIAVSIDDGDEEEED